jgi:putative phosphoesterase
MINIGVISDTHGLVRPEALEALRGSDMILHGGDIGAAEVLMRLESIAKVIAIRGNNDVDSWAQAIPESIKLIVEQVSIYMLHSIKELEIDPAKAGLKVVISGHSHRASIDTRDGVLFLNPGSAGPRRFSLPLTVAMLTVSESSARAEIVDLLVPPSAKKTVKKNRKTRDGSR